MLKHTHTPGTTTLGVKILISKLCHFDFPQSARDWDDISSRIWAPRQQQELSNGMIIIPTASQASPSTIGTVRLSDAYRVSVVVLRYVPERWNLRPLPFVWDRLRMNSNEYNKT